VLVTGLAAVVGIVGIATLPARLFIPAPDSADAGAPPVESAGPFLDDRSLGDILLPVNEQLEAGAFPGAAIAVGVGDLEVHLIGLGKIGWRQNAPAVDPGATIYDLASLTKVVATGSAVVLLADEGELSLDDPVGRFLPEFRDGAKARVTIRHLLTHTSGVPQGATLQGDNRAERIAKARSFSIYPPAGARVEYSDVGYILLGEVVERAAGEPIGDYLERKLFGPLGMDGTRYTPGLDCEACAPTGRLRDQSLYRGRAFDPLAQRLDGVSGHAGLFSTAEDLGRFAAMILNEGELDGVRVLSREMAREFIAPQAVGDGYRLAWEELCPEPITDDGTPCPYPAVIGHTGWTGTSMYIDLESRVWVVLLTNRTYEPRAPNRISEVRREVLSRAIEAARG
jgi:serine-type D-Ala-D-Ala carboxypeptidase